MTGPEEARAALESLRSGGFVALLDSDAPDAEGNLICAAQFVSADSLRAFSSHTGGAALPLPHRCALRRARPRLGSHERRRLAAGLDRPARPRGHGSTRDAQARTIQAVINPSHGPDDFDRIGYVHPLRARPGGVLQRAGRTEAAVDLVRLAGCQPAALLSIVTAEDGDVARPARSCARSPSRRGSRS